MLYYIIFCLKIQYFLKIPQEVRRLVGKPDTSLAPILLVAPILLGTSVPLVDCHNNDGRGVLISLPPFSVVRKDIYCS